MNELIIEGHLKQPRRGGARVGAGRKKNSGAFNEATEPVRIPLSLVSPIKALLSEWKANKEKGICPKIYEKLCAANTKISYGTRGSENQQPEDVGQRLVTQKESAHCFAIVASQPLPEAHIQMGDCLIFNKKKPITNGAVVALLTGEVLNIGVVTIEKDHCYITADLKIIGTAPNLTGLNIWGTAQSMVRSLSS